MIYIQQEAQNPVEFLFDEEILQWVRTSFITWSLGCPNLACQRLAILREEETESDITVELLLLIVRVELGEATLETVDISSEWLFWSLRLWKE